MKYGVVILLLASVIFTGCTTSSPENKYQDYPDEVSREATSPPEGYKHMTAAERRRIYEEGVKDTMRDLKGKTRARDTFVYEPAVRQCGVKIPARVVNGALIPEHTTCVMVSPGRFVEEAPTALPVERRARP